MGKSELNEAKIHFRLKRPFFLLTSESKCIEILAELNNILQKLAKITVFYNRKQNAMVINEIFHLVL
jgi:hypothetical protein